MRVVAAHRIGAILLLVSGFWVVLTGTIFRGLGYNRSILGGDTLIPILTLVYILLAGAFWLRSAKGFRIGLGVASLSVLWFIASGLLSGGYDYPLILLQLLVAYFSLRAYSEYEKAKSRAVHPMDYPVFGWSWGLPMEDYEFEVHVNRVSGGEVANFLRGYLIFKEEKIPFSGVAYGRYGGQNVSPRLTRKAVKRLKELGVDIDRFVSILQRKLVEGDVIIEAKPPERPPPF